MINLKGFGRKQSWSLSYYHNTCLKELREAMKYLSPDSFVPAKIRTSHLPDMSLEHYCYPNPLSITFIA
jgi:hypothetical protein